MPRWLRKASYAALAAGASAANGALIGASIDGVRMAFGDPASFALTGSCALTFAGCGLVGFASNEISKWFKKKAKPTERDRLPLLAGTDSQKKSTSQKIVGALTVALSVPRLLSVIYAAGNAGLYSDHLVDLLHDAGTPNPVLAVLILPVGGLFTQVWHVFGQKIKFILSGWRSLFKSPWAMINSLITGTVKGIGTAGSFQHVLEDLIKTDAEEMQWMITPTAALIGMCYFVNESVMFLEHHKREKTLEKIDSSIATHIAAAIIAAIYGIGNGVLYFDGITEILPKSLLAKIIVGVGAAQVSSHVFYVFRQKVLRIIHNLGDASVRPGKVQLAASANTGLVKGVATYKAIQQILQNNFGTVEPKLSLAAAAVGGTCYTLSEFSLFATHLRPPSAPDSPDGSPASPINDHTSCK